MPAAGTCLLPLGAAVGSLKPSFKHGKKGPEQRGALISQGKLEMTLVYGNCSFLSVGSDCRRSNQAGEAGGTAGLSHPRAGIAVAQGPAFGSGNEHTLQRAKALPPCLSFRVIVREM